MSLCENCGGEFKEGDLHLGVCGGCWYDMQLECEEERLDEER